MKRLSVRALIVGAFITTAFLTLQCNKTTETSPLTQADEYTYLSTAEEGLLFKDGTEGMEEIIECIYTCINSMPVEDLSDSEIATLNFVREEEYLARDVYLAMYNLYGIPVFHHISNSEEIHSTAFQALLEKYNLPDPGANHVQGVFLNQDIQALYDQLIEQGSQSLEDGLIVGETIEDLDIADLINHIENDVDNVDITYALEQLYRGSRNHLRAFNGHLNFLNITYTPQYISQELFDEIVNSPWEIGNGFCVCNFNMPKTEQQTDVE